METILFQDRDDATSQLIKKIPSHLDPQTTIVLGIPRGGVPMAALIASTFHLPMDMLLVRKLTTPSNPEYAIGAVGLDSSWVDEKHHLTAQELQSRIDDERALLRERNKKYRHNAPAPDLKGKTVMLVDDGIATGRTLLHAIELVRLQNPQAIWIIAPVSSPEAATLLTPKVEKLICLHQPKPFIGVGRFYQSFPSVTDEAIMGIFHPQIPEK